MASNFVLKRVQAVKVGTFGADEAGCTDLGSVRELTIATSQEVLEATASKYSDAVVDAALASAKGEITIVAEEITKETLAYALGATVTGDYIRFDGDSALTYITLYARGFYVDGSPYLFHALKCYIRPDTELKLGRDQMLLTIPVVMMVDPEAVGDYKMYQYGPAPEDTTPPTITGVVPADGATSVSKAVGTTVAWTFSEAIRTEDVNAKNFFVHADDGAVKAGTLAIGTSNTVVTFTPSAAWAATTKFHAVAVQGIRDTAGNQLAATSVTDFTTGS